MGEYHSEIEPGAIDSILFAIVTYGEKFWECKSFLSLQDSFSHAKINSNLKVFIVDNTEIPDWRLQVPEFNNIDIFYFHDETNGGISCAYNRAGDYAIHNKLKWLVFLDQDTDLPQDFVQKYLTVAINNKQAKVFVPKIYSGGKIVSPSFYINFRSIPIEKQLPDFLDLTDVSFINSGMLIAVDLFEKVGGYDRNLRIDFCDHSFVERIRTEVGKVGIIDLALNQNFSFNEFDFEKAVRRYSLFLKDFKAYRNSKKNKLTLFYNVDLRHLLKLSVKYKSLRFLRQRLQF